MENSILLKARRRMGWTQRQVAEYAGVTTRTVYRAERAINFSRIMYYFWLMQPIPEEMKKAIVDEMTVRERPYG